MRKLLYKSLLISAFVLINFTFALGQTVGDETASLDFSKIKNQEIARTFENAKGYEKLVLLIFDAKWCPYCKRLNEETLQDEKVIETLSKFERMNVDIDDNPEDARLFNANPASRGGSGIPAMIVLDAEGRELARVKGFHEPKDFIAFLKKQLKKTKSE